MNGEMSVVPSGGNWQFRQNLPDNSVRIFSETSKDKLFKTVEEFRSNNGLPTDRLAEEINRGVSAPIVPQYSDQRSLRERVTAWLANISFHVIRYVPQEEADKRARLSIESPCNITQFTDTCLECYSSTIRGLFAIRQGKSTPYDDQLGACKICGWHIPTAVHLQDSCLSIGKELGHICWNENTEN